MIRSIHRWLGLIVALFWIVQGVTGALIVFRWELDDATLPGARTRLDATSLGESIEAVAQGHGVVSSAWASSDAGDRFDIHYSDGSGAERIRRVDATGRSLRDRSASALLTQGAIFDTLTELHESLLGGTAGTWFVRISGLLLLTNLIFGLRLAWPGARHWARALFVRPKSPGRLQLRAWHRVFGLWGAFPALLLVTAGVLLAFVDDLETWLGVARTEPPPISPPGQVSIAPHEALSIALSGYPGATISAIEMPTPEHGWYRVRLRRADEIHRNWGLTTVVVGAVNGTVIDDSPAPFPNTRRGILDVLYPLHTGQIGGRPGRLFVLCLSAWLLTMIGLGLGSWTRNRSRPQA